MSSRDAPPEPTADPDVDDLVDTIDAPRALRRDAARALADRLYFLGFLCLPWLWVLNAWTFAPHLRGDDAPGRDAHVAKRARASRALAIGTLGIVLAWALGFYFGGARLVGRANWERLSATTQTW